MGLGRLGFGEEVLSWEPLGLRVQGKGCLMELGFRV